MLDLSGMPNRLRNCSATVRECWAGRAATFPSSLIVDPNCCKNISAAATPATRPGTPPQTATAEKISINSVNERLTSRSAALLKVLVEGPRLI